MKNRVLWFMVYSIILSCDRYADPEIKLVRNYSFAFHQDQDLRFFAGEWVGDSIRFTAINNFALSEDSIHVLFEVITGGGHVTRSSAYTDSHGNTYTAWQLGSQSFKQILRAKTYDSAGNYLNSTDLIAYGFRSNEWDTLVNPPEYGITSMVADTVNKLTLMVMGGKIYRQGERYYIWNTITSPLFSSVRAIFIDRNQVFYATAGSGDLILSTDHGESWQLCTRPYDQINYYFNVSITSDNYIWISSYNLPTKYSKDSGQTWIELGSDISTHGIGDVFRLKDGSLILHGADCCSLFRSLDEGLTWTKMDSPGHTYKVYVNDKDEIFLIVHAFTIYKSTDYGTTFKYLYGAGPEWVSGMDNIFFKTGRFYYILAPGWGILKSADLTNIEDYWINRDLRKLFIDHNGVLLALYWNWQKPDQRIAYYRKNSQK